MDRFYELILKYGQGMGDRHILTKLESILPDKMREKVLDQRDELSTPMDVTRFVKKRLNWDKSEKLAAELQKRYSAHVRHAPVAAAIAPDPKDLAATMKHHNVPEDVAKAVMAAVVPPKRTGKGGGKGDGRRRPSASPRRGWFDQASKGAPTVALSVNNERLGTDRKVKQIPGVPRQA